jgi:hypothetical protein
MNSYNLTIKQEKNIINEELLDAIYEAEIAHMKLNQFKKLHNLCNENVEDIFTSCNESINTKTDSSLSLEDKLKYKTLQIEFEKLDNNMYLAYVKYYSTFMNSA